MGLTHIQLYKDGHTWPSLAINNPSVMCISDLQNSVSSMSFSDLCSWKTCAKHNMWDFECKQHCAGGWAWHPGDAVCGLAYGSHRCGGDSHSQLYSSSHDLVPPKSPTAFGTVPASLEDIMWAVGIGQWMAAMTPADRDGA
jgi:hypothetical protein